MTYPMAEVQASPERTERDRAGIAGPPTGVHAQRGSVPAKLICQVQNNYPISSVSSSWLP
jgi:hypothetical protein